MITLLKLFSPKHNLSVTSVSQQGESSHPEISAGDLQSAVDATQLDSRGFEVWIQPDSALTQSQSLLSKRKIDTDVFTIGRRGSGYVSSTQPLRDFALPQNEPYTVSKCHCQIHLSESGATVRDMESRYGTVVNGIRLGGRRAQLKELELGPGAHALVIGPRNSEYRFRLIVE